MKLTTEKDMLKGTTRFTLSWEWGNKEIEENTTELKVLRDEEIPLEVKLLVLAEAIRGKR